MSRSPLAQTVQRPGRKNWRTATKQQILGNFKSQPIGGGGIDSSSKTDGSNADYVRLMIEGMQEKHDQMVAFLKSDLDDNKLEQEEFLSTGLIKLPRAVRTMSVKDFNRKHSCDLLALLKSKDGVVLAGTSQQSLPSAIASAKPPMMDAKKKRCFETPAPRTRRPAQVNTILRTARRGEAMYSMNGSPVAATEPGTVIATVCKKRRGNESASVEINVGDGQYISLNDPGGVSGLDAQMKQTAASQLKVLQDQMASLMAQLEQ